MSDGHDLQRFVDAQEGVYPAALAELRAGRKTSHWMWFVFPQLAGLGRSAMAQRYAIRSASEARAYLAHPVLGARLREVTGAVLGHPGETLAAMLGAVDAMKFASSMTLFEAVSGEALFRRALDIFCGGERDATTLALLGE